MLCDHKKSDIQKHVEALENYLDSAAGAKDSSQHVLSHTDPTEFVPLHATLLQRLQTMSNLKVALFSNSHFYWWIQRGESSRSNWIQGVQLLLEGFKLLFEGGTYGFL